MTFESGIIPEDWRSAVIAPLYNGKQERIECENCRGLLSFVRKMYTGLLIDSP